MIPDPKPKETGTLSHSRRTLPRGKRDCSGAGKLIGTPDSGSQQSPGWNWPWSPYTHEPPAECPNFPRRVAVTRAGRALSASITPGAARGWRAGARGSPGPGGPGSPSSSGCRSSSVAELFIIKEMDPALFTKFFLPPLGRAGFALDRSF